jgi:hypothetical protein
MAPDPVTLPSADALHDTPEHPRDFDMRTNSDTAVGPDPFGDGIAAVDQDKIDTAKDDPADGLASATLAVGRNATLTLATDSLIVLGMRR